jgi:hypothetical protein
LSAAEEKPALEDPLTGSVVPISGMQQARAYHSATVLPDGTVLILGGIGSDERIVLQAELFDPQTKTFSEISSAPKPRAFHTATSITDGRVVVANCVPPYSPDLNPIELAWSKFKQYLRTAKSRTAEALDRAVTEALQTITADNAAAWFRHCGYGIQKS